MFKKFGSNNIISAFIIVAGFFQSGLLAANISIEDLINTASQHFNKQVTVDGFAACPECFQIESGGCSGVLCTGNLALQESVGGGPSIVLAGSFNGKPVGSESDGCELLATPLHIGWKYRVWGLFRAFASSSEAMSFTIAIDSFKVLEQGLGAFDIHHDDYFEGTGANRTAYSFDSTGKSGTWTRLKSIKPRAYLDDGFDTLERGAFKGAFEGGAWNGPWTSYFANGKVKERGAYAGGAKQGLWEEFDSIGKCVSRGPFECGREQGVWKKTLRFGNLPAATFDYQTLSGKIVVTEYAADSVVVDRVLIDRVFSTIEKFETFFADGKKKRLVSRDAQSGGASIEEWLEDGRAICRQSFANGVFSDSLWHATGKLWKTKKKDSGNAAYDFQEFYENGTLAWIGKFKGFAPYGPWLHFSEKGLRTDSIDYFRGAPSPGTFLKRRAPYVFTSFTNTDAVSELSASAQGVWAATGGGVCLFAENGTLALKLTTSNGLPGNNVTALALDKTGTLWVGTDHNAKIPESGGSACCISFVGEPLAKLTTQNGLLGGVSANSSDTGLKNQTNRSTYLVGAREKNGLWCYFDSVTVDQYAPPIAAVAPAADGSLWSSSLNGVRRLPLPLSKQVKDKLGLYVNYITAQADSTVWIVGPDSLYRIKGDSVARYKPVDDVPAGELMALLSGREGKLYALSAKGIFIFSEGQFRKIITLGPNDTPFRTPFFQDGDNSFIIAAARGIVRVSKTASSVLVRPAQLGNVPITALAKDLAGLWIGTKKGVFRASGKRVTQCVDPDGPRGDHVEFVRADARSGVWTFIKGVGLYHYDNKTWALFDARDKLSAYEIQDALPDQKGGAWVGTDKGLIYLSSRATLDTNSPNPSFKGSITQLAVDRYKTIRFVRNDNAVVAFDGREFRVEYDQPALIDGVIRAFAVDSAGALWVSNNRGIVKTVNGVVRETLTSAHGLPQLPITRIFIGRNNMVYALSLQTVYKYDGKKWASIFTEDNINGSIVSSIAQDARGDLWVGTKDGLFRFGDRDRERFTQSDGLIGSAINDISFGPEGAVWVATEQGLCRLMPGGGRN